MSSSRFSTTLIRRRRGEYSYISVELVLLVIAALFVFTNSLALALGSGSESLLQHFWAPIIWLVAVSASWWLLNQYARNRDRLLFPAVAMLAGWGLILIKRLAVNFLARQTLWLILGLTVMLLLAIFPGYLKYLRRYRYSLLIFGLVLVLGTFIFGVNPSGAGAALWLKIPLLGDVYFQPAELLKILLVIFLASYFDEQEMLSNFRSKPRSRRQQLGALLPLFVMWSFSMIILVWQRDLGTAALFFIVFLALLYLATGSWKMVFLGLGMLLTASYFAYRIFDVVALRIDTWIDPWPEATGRGFQIAQSLYAIASGGLLGEGAGQGTPTYIPVVHSDFAFAAAGEEWGLIGGLTIVVLFSVLAYRGFRIAALATRPFHLYLSAGIAAMFSVQAILIMGGVTKILPLTGVTLPFMSYGGSSMLVSFVMVGLLLAMSRAAGNRISLDDD